MLSMELSTIVEIFILIPFIGFIISLVIPQKNEDALSATSYLTVGLHWASINVFVVYWIVTGFPTFDHKYLTLYKTTDYEFFLDLYFDKITAVYLFVGSFLTFLVTIYSRYYLHREVGYKRFFNTILFFYLGYNIAVLSGNLETLFIGWEVLGISSFLLIAFYRNRYLPVKNAVKVFSVYRVADVGLILAMWMSHHLWHENVTFAELNNYTVVHEHLQSHTLIGVFISLMILISAVAKSAQLPFSSWLPRAMEGPTPSSAIFYGSLSVHLGVFLLLRTYPFWEQQTSVRILIALIGLLTAFITTGIARVQSSVKSQIAYASIGQIGLIFIELAAGFENLALIHFAGNAFLRTYQLLVSPSVVTYLIREQFYNFSPRVSSIERFYPKKMAYSLYILCIKEWNLDSMMYRFFWNPLKWLGNKLNFLTIDGLIVFFIPAYIIGMFSFMNKDFISPEIVSRLPILFSLIALTMVLKAFTERKISRLSWLLIIMNHLWVALAISFNENFKYGQPIMYLSGIMVFGIIGYLCLRRLKRLEGNINLNQFHGHAYRHPKISLVFLICCLGVSGFPISPTFIGEDLIFTHIHEDQAVLALFTSLSFILDGLAIIRIYARVFLGPHVKSVYEMAYRSS
jgi:NADH:ubiquinone oxidoreductase subunit 5 (subunit L)/multisubunit Na+/H+ antiporter MnhA subunit